MGEAKKKRRDWRAWVGTPRGLWIRPAQLDAAEAELDTLQRPGDELTLTVGDVCEARETYHELVTWAWREDLDPRAAKGTIYAGDVATDDQTPDRRCTVVEATAQTLRVYRTMAPSWPTRRGRCVVRELPAPARATPYVIDHVAGLHFGGRVVWR